MLTPGRLGLLAIRDYKFPPHLQLLQRELLGMLVGGGRKRAIVEMPVQHGKSFFCSFLFPAWLLMMRPETRIIVVSHTKEFANEFGQKVQELVGTYGPKLTGVSLNPYFKGACNFKIWRSQGSFTALGLLSGIAGRSADWIVADDICKDEARALSPEHRDKLTKWFHSEVLSRASKNCGVVVVGSRRHPDDLQGRLYRDNDELAEADRWTRLRMQAIHENPETGEESALWPEMFPLDVLKMKRQDAETKGLRYQFECLYQNSPESDPSYLEWPEEWFRRIWYDEKPNVPCRLRLMSLDPAKGSDARTGNQSATILAEIDHEGVYWIEDSWHTAAPITKIVQQFAALVGEYKPDGVVVESNLFQEVVADGIVDLCQEQGILCPMHKFLTKSIGDFPDQKEIRIRISLTPLLAQNKIRLRKTHGNKKLFNQLREFPHSAYIDAADSLEIMVRLANYLQTAKREEGPQEMYHPVVV
jgi:hypothetical protein